MKDILLTCDRCGKVIHGGIYEDPMGKVITTSGFYDVSDGPWSRFARWEEERICDACMHSCPKYKAVYGK